MNDIAFRPLPPLAPEQAAELEAALKRGLAGQLRAQGLLSDAQLYRLLQIIGGAADFAERSPKC